MYHLLLLALLATSPDDTILLAQAEPLSAKAAAAKAAAEKSAAAAKAKTEAAEKAAAKDAEAEKAKVDEKAAAEKQEKAAEDAKAAEESSEAATEEPGLLAKMSEVGAIGYMIAGGIFMWPILILGIIAGGVFIERYRSLRMLRTDTTALREEVRDLLQQDRVEDAYKLCDSEQGPVPAILSTGLRQFLVLRRLGYDPGKIEEQVIKSMDDYSVHIVAALERHLPILATVSSVAPMIGFLGTVQGMVVSFDDIVRTMGEVNIVQAAADGIRVALLTTCLGLIVGIPAFMAYNYFTSVINRFILEVEESASELIEVVTLQMAMKNADMAEHGGAGTNGNSQSVAEGVASYKP